METHRVEISVQNGDFKYTPESVRVFPGDTIEWVCGAGPFAVHLGWGTPCSKGRVRGDTNAKVSTSVRTNATNGQYKYMVAVSVNGQIYTDDPEIVVKPKT